MLLVGEDNNVAKKDTRLEELLIARLDKLEDKVDKIVPDVAVLVEKNKSSSKLHSSLAGVLAVLLSVMLGKYHQ